MYSTVLHVFTWSKCYTYRMDTILCILLNLLILVTINFILIDTHDYNLLTVSFYHLPIP